MSVKVGDWVRFYQGGKLVIGVVQYAEKDLLGYMIAKTDIGVVDVRYILEARGQE
jgi:hypothetical protein